LDWIDFRPSRRRGQVFLKSRDYAQRLVAALEIEPSDTVVEIGAGQGILTEQLSRSGPAKIYAIEVDPRLALDLRARFQKLADLEVIEADILKLDLAKFKEFKVLGNLPYSITTPILFKLLNCRAYWKWAVLTLQAEFARRLLARPATKDYGRISVVFQFYTRIFKLFDIPPGCFWPRPKVVSTAIRLEVRRSPLVELKTEAKFLKLVQVAFAQRRKCLVNALSAVVKDRDGLISSLLRLELSPRVRAEQVSPEKFGELANLVYNLL
jgi:16S rRNA (adenine1518-N6/adenine1519-N6)-dimethyltransferase